MKDLSLSDAFRFLLPGVMFGICFYFSDATLVDQILSATGLIGIALILVVVGAVIYLLYRPFVYDTLILWLHDKLRRHSDNYRTYLKKKYKVTTRDAMLIWSEIRDEYFADRYTELKTFSSSIHFLYIGGLLTLGFSIRQFLAPNITKGLSFFGIFFLLSLAAAP